MRIFSVFVFFVSFYKIPVLFPYAYISLVFSGFAIIVLTKPVHNRIFLSSIGLWPLIIVFFIAAYSFSIDVVSGSFFSNFSNSFFVRAASLLVISALPAYFLVSCCLRWDFHKALDVIVIGFWVQILFWGLTYIDPSLKYFVNSIMGGSENSVNLRAHNFDVRGFGISSEINFTTPFVSVLVCLILIRRKAVSFLTTITQLVNSNLVLVAVVVAMVFSKIKLRYKVFLAILGVGLIYFVGEAVFPRLLAEFSNGGSRTILVLLSKHIVIVNEGLWEHFFGSAVYSFQGGGSVSSDIGWINMYNYGGAVLLVLYFFFLFFLSASAFGYGVLGLVWFGAGLILNTKGLLFSPNSYFFITFVFLFLNYGARYQGCCMSDKVGAK